MYFNNMVCVSYFLVNKVAVVVTNATWGHEPKLKITVGTSKLCNSLKRFKITNMFLACSNIIYKRLKNIH